MTNSVSDTIVAISTNSSLDTTLSVLGAVAEITTALVTVAGVFIALKSLKAINIQLSESKKQLENNHDWNRRVEASKNMLVIQEKTMPFVKILNAHLGYSRRELSKAYTVQEIHEKLCGKNPKADQSSGLLIMTDEGKKISGALTEFLNMYEFIAVNVLHGVYDEALVKEYHRGNILKVHHLFTPYIRHYNEDMYPMRKGKIWENIGNLAKNWIAIDNLSEHNENLKKWGKIKDETENKKRAKTGTN